jgi:hypothetical protein
MRTPRHLVTALALLTAGTVVGVAAQQSVSADVSSGDRPVLIQITACRLADTRPAPDNVGPRMGKLGPGETVTFDAQDASTKCAGKIPTDAVGLSMNVTALNATSKSFFTIWPSGPLPLASSLNPAPGEPPTPNGVATPIEGGKFNVYNNRGNSDILIDINGYYVNHDHDDVYLSEAEIDAKIAASGGGSTAGTLSVGAAAFDAWESQFDWAKDLAPSIGGGGAWITSNPHGGGFIPGLAAPIQLPDGATITEVTAYFTDTSAISALALQLRCEEFDGGVKVVASGSSTASPASGEDDLVITTQNATVDNSACNYFFIAESGSWGSEKDDLKIRGVSITTT